MSLKSSTSTRYGYGLVFTRFWPKNDDLSLPSSSNIVGGIGPFDLSASPTDIGVTVKIDDDDAVDLTVNVSGADDTSAVTAAELASALDTAFSGKSLDLDASVDSNGRIKIATTLTTSVPTHIQVYGDGAKTAMFGQGFGQKILKTDTLRSLGEAPNMKEDETFTTTDADGDDTEVIEDGYRKGSTLSLIDTAEDWEIVSLIEGGTLDDDGVYEAPTIDTTKVQFVTEMFYKQYRKGTNNEADIVGYAGMLYRSCKGQIGDRNHERGFMDGNFTIMTTAHKEADGTILSDYQRTPYTVEEYLALDLENV